MSNPRPSGLFGQSEDVAMTEREGTYEYAMTAIPSSPQVAITKPEDIDKLPGSGKVVLMLTVFGFLLV